MAKNWRRSLSSLGYSMQPTYKDETAVGFQYVLCEPVDVDLAREVTDADLLEGQEGAVADRYVGSRHGSTVTVAFPLRTFSTAYDPTSDDPTVHLAPEYGLIAPFFGCGPSTAETGTAQAGAASAITLAAGASAVDDTFNNQIIEITGGTGSGQFNKITDYVGASKVATVENAWTTTPDATSTYSIVINPNQPTHTSVYDANDVDSASGVSITHTAGTYKGGDFYVAATTGTAAAAPTMGWIQEGNTGAAVTKLFEPPQYLPVSGDETFPTLTYYMSTTQPQPITMRLVGDSQSNAGLVLIGCIPQSVTISFDPRSVPRAEVVYTCTDYRWDNTIEGLHIPTDAHKVPPVLGTNNGRATMGNTSDAATTSAGAVQCGLGSVSFSITNEIAYTACHSAAQGVESATITKRTVRAEFTVPHESTDPIYDAAGNTATSGQHKWSSYLERGVQRSIAFYVGANVSKCFSLFIPAAKVVEQPSLVDQEGVYGYNVAVEASTYAGDTDDGNKGSAGDSNVRIGIG